MGMLVKGRWAEKAYEVDGEGRFQRDSTTFREHVGSPAHPLEPGRYVLYVSYACPWSHRTILTRSLKGLEPAVEMVVAHPHMGAEGWRFGQDFPGSQPDPVLGARLMRELYLAADPEITTRVTVPVLWDRATGTIVNNESRDIMRMLDHVFSPLAEHDLDLCPPDLGDAVDTAIDELYAPVNNGVYRAGFATTQQAYEEACTEVFNGLNHWEAILGRHRYCCGDRPTEADLCLFVTALRFDPVYALHFKCNNRRLSDFPNLSGWLRDLYQRPEVRATCRLDHIKHHYYTSHPFLNPRGIIPLGPELDLDSPHDRERFG